MFSANPMRMDVEEIGRMIGVDLALNVVLDNKKEIVGVFFGEPKSVMQKGIALSRNLCQMQAPQDYDLVICSAGGFPKDINLYQAQKAITHASAFLKDGGVVLLSAECREGFGSKGFQQFLESHQHPQDIIRTFENSQFNMGPHKAYQLALQAQRYQIVLISSLETQHALKNMINQVKNLKTGIDLCRQWLPHDPKIAILPYATHLMNMQEYEK